MTCCNAVRKRLQCWEGKDGRPRLAVMLGGRGHNAGQTIRMAGHDLPRHCEGEDAMAGHDLP